MIWDIKYKNEIKKREISGKYNPIVLALLKNRGIEAEEEVDNFFNFNYENLTDPLEILGMKEALERIELAKNKKEKIAIYGDYDADGVTASALLRETLENLGFSEVLIYIPDRQTEGYGMNEAAIAYIKQKGASLIITVDCGITSAREVEKAKELGIDVIITDHHHAPPEIPKAVAVINPHLNNSGFKFRDFAGVGVAFKLAQAVYKKISPDKIEQLKWSLDLVAIGTIADCVNLLSENRILVKYGLLVLSKTKRAGLQEMFKVGRIIISENDVPNAHKVAFQIAPRINAAGRMDHANIAFNLLIEKDKIKAREMSLELESKNQERQKITADIVKKIEMIANNSFRDKKIIFAENLHWPVGILGLVAGKTAENFKKPTVILQKQEKEYVGSLRSIPEVDIMEVLEECSEFLFKFGGHSQAAGVSIKHENVEKFYDKFISSVDKKLEGKEIESFIKIDCEIKAEDINWDIMNEIRKMEPFGVGNEEPVFVMNEVIVNDLKICGNGSKHLKMSLRSQGSPKIFDSIGFGLGEKFSHLKSGDKINIVFNLCEDEWNGNKKLQFRLIDIKIYQTG